MVRTAGASATTQSRADALRLENAARENFQFIWRCLRRFGVQPDHAVDDAVQRVFEIAATRVDIIRVGHERAFLFKTAVLVAKERRRAQANPRELLDVERLANEADPGADPERSLDEQRNRALLDWVLDKMPADLRDAFVLHELEGLAMHEIARLLEIPAGTVASRLRRAREHFQKTAQLLRARLGR
ncbi:MAG: RNA polymerase sigma factor [Myxococcota bacterium]